MHTLAEVADADNIPPLSGSQSQFDTIDGDVGRKRYTPIYEG